MSEYLLEHFVLELIQPGTTSSPWRSFLETYLTQKLLNGMILPLDELR